MIFSLSTFHKVFVVVSVYILLTAGFIFQSQNRRTCSSIMESTRWLRMKDLYSKSSLQSDALVDDDEEDTDMDDLDTLDIKLIEKIVNETGDIKLIEELLNEKPIKTVEESKTPAEKFNDLYKDIKNNKKNSTKLDAGAMLASLFDAEKLGDPFDERKMFVKLRQSLSIEDFKLLFDDKVGEFL